MQRNLLNFIILTSLTSKRYYCNTVTSIIRHFLDIVHSMFKYSNLGLLQLFNLFSRYRYSNIQSLLDLLPILSTVRVGTHYLTYFRWYSSWVLTSSRPASDIVYRYSLMDLLQIVSTVQVLTYGPTSDIVQVLTLYFSYYLGSHFWTFFRNFPGTHLMDLL